MYSGDRRTGCGLKTTVQPGSSWTQWPMASLRWAQVGALSRLTGPQTARFRHKGRRCWKIDKPALMRTMLDTMTTSYFDGAAAGWDEEPTRVRFMKAVGEAIVREVAPTRDMTVLDYGCRTGLLGLYLLPCVRGVTGADNSPGMLQVLNRKIAEGGLNNMRGGRLNLAQDPVLDDRYHMIVAGMVRHPIANPGKTLRAFHKQEAEPCLSSFTVT